MPLPSRARNENEFRNDSRKSTLPSPLLSPFSPRENQERKKRTFSTCSLEAWREVGEEIWRCLRLFENVWSAHFLVSLQENTFPLFTAWNRAVLTLFENVWRSLNKLESIVYDSFLLNTFEATDFRWIFDERKKEKTRSSFLSNDPL